MHNPIDDIETKIPEKLKNSVLKFFNNDKLSLTFILILKIIFQFTILGAGYRWLSADDYCRTVKSFEWLQKPEIHSGVWLSMHFWLNGFFMIFIKNIVVAAGAVSFVFSAISVIYFYKIIEICFDKKIALWSSIIFCLFPFQVWLSLSGLPESTFFFFIIAGIYYFIKWKQVNKKIFLILASVSFALSNGFRYEGWLFSLTFIGLVAFDFWRQRKFSKELLINLLISFISLVTIFWWILQNYIDYKDAFFFMNETSKIYDNLNVSKYLQKFVQYPVFIVYIAPITTFFAIKVSYDLIWKEKLTLAKYFILFNAVELTLLIVQGIMGTGGTNMISRYVVINGILFIPFCVVQFFKFKKLFAVSAFAGTIVIYIIWSYYFPQPFREDTFEVGYTLREQILKNYIGKNEKIYFEEIDGFYDTFPIQAISNDPSRFILGNLPELAQTEKKNKKKNSLSDEELNIIDVKNYLNKNEISLAVVKSETYANKLLKISLRNEDIGDYKLFYFRDRKSNLSDSSIKLFAKNITSVKDNPGIVNYDKLLAVKDFSVDNTYFGANPQSVAIEWNCLDKNIIDSIDYDNYGFDRYSVVLELRLSLNDSLVHIETKKIFSERNIEDLLETNSIRTIMIIKPFALLQYSMRKYTPPFESGLYDMLIKIKDVKYNRDLVVYRGDSLYKREPIKVEDSSRTMLDSIKKKSPPLILLKQDSLQSGYSLGYIIAFFPNTDFAKLIKQSNSNIYKIMLRSGFQVLFAQRYQGDHFLDFVFSYF